MFLKLVFYRKIGGTQVLKTPFLGVLQPVTLSLTSYFFVLSLVCLNFAACSQRM
ncbi:hypothetical protein HMPREF0650_2303 [Hoylesella buccalis ATCC 35310]|uniref:Uncharacterized protein n=1 Tax=Hoylesella buccalis ATCC 35310 TaxID=679190 RepID=D1W8N0_9BACT|nr:hypothetical protein HMPREF0650_2303 [Hoylesella buccalis ATCC 35310]